MEICLEGLRDAIKGNIDTDCVICGRDLNVDYDVCDTYSDGWDDEENKATTIGTASNCCCGITYYADYRGLDDENSSWEECGDIDGSWRLER